MTGQAGPAISAVLVSYYTGPLLGRAIARLAGDPAVAEIVLVDNGNWPGAVEAAVAASAGGAPVIVLTGHGNVGFAAGCNLGARAARSPLLLFLNPDSIPTEGAIDRLVESAARVERPFLIAPKLVDPDGAEQRGSRRETLTPWRALVEATRLDRLAPRHPYFRRFNQHDAPCPPDIAQVPTISGAGFLIPHEDYFAIDGMDESFFLHVEDVDFCLRFARAGGAVWFDPKAALVHYRSRSRASPLRVEARKTASLMRYFRRHFRREYPPLFMEAVGAVLWARWAAFAAKRGAFGALSAVGLTRRRGLGGLRRARSISAGRRSR